MQDDKNNADVKPGPDPDRLKVEDDWEEAVEKALKREKPPAGWPEPPRRYKKRKRAKKRR